jgi:L-seryl-tRNA(Ser) seleniumtransferase
MATGSTIPRSKTRYRTNVYTRLGVTPLINARGTWTYLGGSLQLRQVMSAKREAARYYVDMFELQAAVSTRLAALSGAEAGMITSGAAAALAAATAGCIAGTDPTKIWRLPDSSGMKNQVVLFGGRLPFDSAIRLAGGKLTCAGTVAELRAATGRDTAMICTTRLGADLECAIEIAREVRVPLLLDAAADIPPVENIGLYARMGVDLYAFSGGKGLCGPQASGLLLGRKHLIEAAQANCSPWEGSVCRAMKVSKEDTIACLAAVETWAATDPEKWQKKWCARIERIEAMVGGVPGVRTRILVPELANRYPALDVSWDPDLWRFTAADCYQALRQGEPRIEVLIANNPSLLAGVSYDDSKTLPPADTVRIVSMTLQPGEDRIVGQRLRQVLLQAAQQTECL